MKKTILTNVLAFDLSTEGLDPLKHRIIGITCKTIFEERIFTQRDEKKLLEDFWNYLKLNDFKKVIGFNSENFDIPVLIVRSLKNNVEMTVLNNKSIDLRKAIFKDEHRKGKLKDFKELLDINFPENGFKKMHMSILWDEDIKELRELLLQDVRITFKLYDRVRGVGLIA